MSLSNKEMDAAVEKAAADEADAIDNKSNNNPAYLAGRYYELHGNGNQPVPVKKGVPVKVYGNLFAVIQSGRKKNTGDVRAGNDNRGIFVTCRDDGNDDVAEYYAESNGLNAIEILRKSLS